MRRGFWETVDKTETCWLWTGGCLASGYGGFHTSDNKTHLAHRVAYEELVGPIPHGLVLDHLCRVPTCVNPDHLEAVTQRENILRGNSPSARQARQTHCIRGHAFSGDNLILLDGGKRRRCRTCSRLYDRARRDPDLLADYEAARADWTVPSRWSQ